MSFKLGVMEEEVDAGEEMEEEEVTNKFYIFIRQ